MSSAPRFRIVAVPVALAILIATRNALPFTAAFFVTFAVLGFAVGVVPDARWRQSHGAANVLTTLAAGVALSWFYPGAYSSWPTFGYTSSLAVIAGFSGAVFADLIRKRKNRPALSPHQQPPA